MADNEFSIIDRYFARTSPAREDVVLGIGDDAAILEVPPGQQLVVTTDTLVSGVHFPVDTDPRSIGHKSLAVNLSDLAAMGATPAWVTLALTLPEADPDWLQAFAEGFFTLAAQHHVALVGGDTTHGPLSITVQAQGLVPRGQALRRDGAQPGDVIMVTGTLGDAALGLRERDQQPDAALRARLDRPTPRVALGQALRGVVSSAIDISDGLLADLGHVVSASGCGARIHVTDLPVSTAFADRLQASAEGRRLQLTGGDDYELCFTVSLQRLGEVERAAQTLSVPVTVIGEIEAEPGIRCLQEDGQSVVYTRAGYDHFA